MATLIEKTRQVLAVEDDDFFQSETILYYLNKSQEKVVSYMIQKEREAERSLRSLDSLRKRADVTIVSSFSQVGSLYWKGEVTFPTNTNQFSYLRYNDRTILRELLSHNLFRIEWGNLKPTEYEGYYTITGNDSDQPVFELYLHEEPDGTTDTLYVYHIVNPTEIVLADETLAELPDQLENSVIYGAATMMATQEQLPGAESFSSIYQEELQASSY